MSEIFRKSIHFDPDHPFNVAKTQVALPQDAFSRALPFVVNETQRFRINALVVCADIVTAAYHRMVELAIRSEWEDHQANEARTSNLHTLMFQQAWSIVDQIYSIRMLLQSLKLSGPKIESFLSATEKTHSLRNRMDHLDQLIPNIVKSKNVSRSLFGSLSYIVSGAAVGSSEADVFMVFLNTEPTLSGEAFSSRAPYVYHMPIGNFVLSAAGEMLDFDSAILALGPVMTRLSVNTEKSIRAQVAEEAERKGVREEEFLTHLGSHAKIKLAIRFDEIEP